jgi:FkbM family methyltransferase
MIEQQSGTSCAVRPQNKTAKSIKRAIRRFIQGFGYEFVRTSKTRIGVDPLMDIQRFLEGTRDPLILDVGANVGQSVDAFRKAFPSSQIHSFEPSPSTYRKLEAHCGPFPNVKTWNYGVGSSDTTLPFQENDESDMSSFLPPGELCWGKIIKTTDVPVIALDSFAEREKIEFVHLLKSDTQGFDFEVFKGGGRLMRENRIGLIYFELIFSEMYKGLPPFHEVLRYLTDHNFAVVTFYQPHFQRKIVSWTNVLLINRDYYRDRVERAGLLSK